MSAHRVTFQPARLDLLVDRGASLTLNVHVTAGGSDVDISGWDLTGDRCTIEVTDGPAGRFDCTVNSRGSSQTSWAVRRTEPDPRRLVAGTLTPTDEAGAPVQQPTEVTVELNDGPIVVELQITGGVAAPLTDIDGGDPDTVFTD